MTRGGCRQDHVQVLLDRSACMRAGEHQSLWNATAPGPTYPSLEKDLEMDVAIIGGGALGITCAYLLTQEGQRVAVLEANRVLAAVTGATTAKVTAQHGTILQKIVDRHGEDKARLYAEANDKAKEEIARLVDTLAIDAAFTRAPAFAYTKKDDKVDELVRETEIAQRFGLPASFVEDTELPFTLAGAMRFDDQAHFHPRKYLLTLTQKVIDGGGQVFEHTPVVRYRDTRPATVSTPRATVTARDVVVATNVPIGDRTSFISRMQPRRHYGIAVPDEGRSVEGMHVNLESPNRSVRPYDSQEGPMLVIVGNNHPTGHPPPEDDPWRGLERFAIDHFRAGPTRYRWSSQDFYPFDHLPMVGPAGPVTRHLYTGTGFQGWGMTNTMAAATVLRDQILDRENDWSGIYDPFNGARILKDIAPDTLKAQGHIAKMFLLDRMKQASLERLQPGEGKIVTVNGKKVAVHKTEDGLVQARSAVCTHMGCLVRWNKNDTSWDCPCHGSRFAPDGSVLHGPAMRSLDERAAAEKSRDKPAAQRS